MERTLNILKQKQFGYFTTTSVWTIRSSIWHGLMDTNLPQFKLMNTIHFYLQITTRNSQLIINAMRMEICKKCNNHFKMNEKQITIVNSVLGQWMLIQLDEWDRFRYSAVTFSYHSSILRAIFVYGTDFKREIDIIIFRISKSVKIVAALIASLSIGASINLYTIRKRFKLPTDDVGSVTLDCDFGGWTLRMAKKIKKFRKNPKLHIF